VTTGTVLKSKLTKRKQRSRKDEAKKQQRGRGSCTGAKTQRGPTTACHLPYRKKEKHGAIKKHTSGGGCRESELGLETVGIIFPPPSRRRNPGPQNGHAVLPCLKRKRKRRVLSVRTFDIDSRQREKKRDGHWDWQKYRVKSLQEEHGARSGRRRHSSGTKEEKGIFVRPAWEVSTSPTKGKNKPSPEDTAEDDLKTLERKGTSIRSCRAHDVSLAVKEEEGLLDADLSHKVKKSPRKKPSTKGRRR